MPDGYLAYFTRRFPQLFLHVHTVIRTSGLRSESMFRSYFELPDWTGDSLHISLIVKSLLECDIHVLPSMLYLYLVRVSCTITVLLQGIKRIRHLWSIWLYNVDYQFTSNWTSEVQSRSDGDTSGCASIWPRFSSYRCYGLCWPIDRSCQIICIRQRRKPWTSICHTAIKTFMPWPQHQRGRFTVICCREIQVALVRNDISRLFSQNTSFLALCSIIDTNTQAIDTRAKVHEWVHKFSQSPTGWTPLTWLEPVSFQLTDQPCQMPHA